MLNYVAYIVKALEGQNKKSAVNECHHFQGQYTGILKHCFHPFIMQLFIEHLLYARHCVTCFINDIRYMKCSAQC